MCFFIQFEWLSDHSSFAFTVAAALQTGSCYPCIVLKNLLSLALGLWRPARPGRIPRCVQRTAGRLGCGWTRDRPGSLTWPWPTSYHPPSWRPSVWLSGYHAQQGGGGEQSAVTKCVPEKPVFRIWMDPGLIRTLKNPDPDLSIN